MDQQQLAIALEGLSDHQHTTLRQALSRVDLVLIDTWLKTSALREWVQQGSRLLANQRARGEQFLLALYAATPTILPVLALGEIGEWIKMGVDIADADQAGFFSHLPDDFAELGAAERQSLYRLVRGAAYRSPQAAAALYRALPRSLRPIPLPLREPLVRCLQAAATFDPEPLPAILPFLGPTLRGLSAESSTLLLEQISRLSRTFPAGVARLFRVLARAYEEVGEEGVRAWIIAGEEIARRNPQAGEAFFALESRTSLLVLRRSSPAVSLSDIQGLLLRYMHMLCGSAVSIHETDRLSFPPPLAEGTEAGLPLPAHIEVFPTYEENLRLYRVLAAHQAGRVEFGTYEVDWQRLWPALPETLREVHAPDNFPVDDFTAYFRLFSRPEHLEALFLYVESKRIAAQLSARYRGLREDLRWAETLAQLSPPAWAALFPRLSERLWSERVRFDSEATVSDSLLLATELYLTLTPFGTRPTAPAETPSAEFTNDEDEEEALSQTDAQDGQSGSDIAHLSAEEQEMLQKIIAALHAHSKRKKPSPRKPQKKGVATFIELPATLREGEEPEERQGKQKNTTRRLRTAAGMQYLYDEWDFLIEDYRTQWCQLREFPLTDDAGAFFANTLAAYTHLTPEIKREFQRLRPRQYRQVKGLEDGETIDLDAAIGARVDRLSGTAPSTKLYAARQAVERDVATLFLLDLSASTDSRVAGREDLRVIDVMKEAIVLLSSALDDIGDVYAIYGFSSHGRRNVEVYPVKTFVESLSANVKGRIGGLTPQRSTRMGTAVRHATRKLKDLSSRAKLLVLLSDGYPEDADYGRDDHTPTYGVRDTMMALREAEQHGILSFCLTVDKGGHDYLREMCAPSRYMVIEDITSLPAELPKIYQRYIRSQSVQGGW
jgi:hypothetical protein